MTPSGVTLRMPDCLRLVLWVTLLLSAVVTSLTAALIPPNYVDSVVAIGVFANGPGEPELWVPVATGFFYGVPEGGDDPASRQYRIYLVSNRHVLDGPRQLIVRINPEEVTERARIFTLVLKDESGRNLWTGHPNRAIDVAVAPVDTSVLLREGRRTGFFAADQHAADKPRLRELGISMGDPVFLLGFPMALVGTAQRNYVIARKGSIARISDVLEEVETTFLIDAFAFPGNSGGPVVSVPNPTAVPGTRSQDRSYLIGILSASLNYIDYAVSVQTKDVRLKTEENSGLAVVFPVDYINQTISADRAKEQR